MELLRKRRNKATCTPFKVIASVMSLALVQNITAQTTDGDVDKIIAGISNHGQTNHKEYLTPGERAYVVGTQDGNFPDLGSHVQGEMGGLWIPPDKLLDGFWVKLSDAHGKQETWLQEATQFINYPYGNRFVYAPIDGIEVERLQFCQMQMPGIAIHFKLKNTSGRLRTVRFSLVAN